MGAPQLEAQAKARRRGREGYGLGGVRTGDERRKKGLTRWGRAVGGIGDAGPAARDRGRGGALAGFRCWARARDGPRQLRRS